MIRRAVAIAVAASLLAAGKPAKAEEPGPGSAGDAAATRRADDAASTRRIFIYSGYGVAAVGLGLSFVFLAQANSAYSERLDIARQNGSVGQTAWKCQGVEQCARMNELREDQAAAKERWGAMMGVTIGGAVAGTVFLVAHLLESQPAKRSARPQLAPAVSHQGGGLQLWGTF